MESFPKLIGQRLRLARKQQSLSQEKTAERAGLHPTYIGQLERGEKKCYAGKHPACQPCVGDSAVRTVCQHRRSGCGQAAGRCSVCIGAVVVPGAAGADLYNR